MNKGVFPSWPNVMNAPMAARLSPLYQLTPPPTGGGGGGTTLDSFAGLVAWYKGPISGATNGAAIPSWPDSKGTYNLTSQSNTVYNSSAINSLPSVSFNGSNSYVFNGGPSSSSYPATLVAVINCTDVPNPRTILGSSSAAGLQWRLEQSSAYQGVLSEFTLGIGTSSPNSVATGSWAILMVVVTSTSYSFYINGTSAGSGSHSVSLTAGRTFEIGRTPLNNEYFYGQIAEVGIYNADRSSDATAIYASLKSKYAL